MYWFSPVMSHNDKNQQKLFDTNIIIRLALKWWWYSFVSKDFVEFLSLLLLFIKWLKRSYLHFQVFIYFYFYKEQSIFNVLRLTLIIVWYFISLFQSQNGDPDSLYIVLNGRLRAVQQEEGTGKKTLGDETGRGEFVGLVSFDIILNYYFPFPEFYHTLHWH